MRILICSNFYPGGVFLNSKIANLFNKFFKGFFIGLGALIPGVSGGTTAMVFGVFEEILDSIGNFFSHAKKSVCFLLPLSVGAIVSVVTFSGPITFFCEYFPLLSKYTFCTLAAISTYFFVKNNLKISLSFKKTLFMLFGIIVSGLISIFSTVAKTNFNHESVLFLFIIGIPLALALVLPAISFSYMMYFFGIYERTIFAIKTFDFLYLLPLIGGIILGVFIFSKTLILLIKKYNQETYSFVFGFVLFSLTDLLIT